jgi:hypothetical protein
MMSNRLFLVSQISSTSGQLTSISSAALASLKTPSGHHRLDRLLLVRLSTTTLHGHTHDPPPVFILQHVHLPIQHLGPLPFEVREPRYELEITVVHRPSECMAEYQRSSEILRVGRRMTRVMLVWYWEGVLKPGADVGWIRVGEE